MARSESPVSMRDCAAGWYAVRPLGFVCSDADATIRLDDPLPRAIEVEPDRSKPLPYAYAFTQDEVPNYSRVPTPAEQLDVEPELERHLVAQRERAQDWHVLPLGANDVPLRRDGLAAGPIPDAAEPLDLLARLAGGEDAVPWWLDGGRQIPNLAPFQVIPGSAVARLAQRHAGVALIGTFLSQGPGAVQRRFAISTDARLLPTDKLRGEAGSTFHGQDVREVGLPVAFGFRNNARHWSLEGERLIPGDPLPPRAFVPLSGTVRVMGGERMVEARDGRWLRSNDLHVAVKPRQLPWYAQQERRWIDVSLTHQVLVAWEGAKPVFVTLVSTGKDGFGDPETTQSTPQGTFRIQQKHVTTTMDSEAADNEFELRDVPWVMYFKGGYALHGAYWHDDFGRMRSHGCVNLSPIDARHVFEWSLPDVPEHWHGAYASDSFGSGTLVRIHR